MSPDCCCTRRLRPLASVARKEIEGRGWVRELTWKLINLGQAERFGFTTEVLYRQTDLQVAAVGWLSQHALFAEAAEKHDRFRTVARRWSRGRLPVSTR